MLTFRAHTLQTLISKDSHPQVLYHRGFKVGHVYTSSVYLYNHLKFTIKYHEGSAADKYRIVGFEVSSDNDKV